MGKSAELISLISFLYKGHLTGLLRQWRTRSIKQREEHMNTITIMSTVEGTPSVTYTEGEVLRYIDKAKGIDELNDLLNKQVQTIRDLKNKVRDFFSEGDGMTVRQSSTKVTSICYLNPLAVTNLQQSTMLTLLSQEPLALK